MSSTLCVCEQCQGCANVCLAVTISHKRIEGNRLQREKYPVTFFFVKQPIRFRPKKRNIFLENKEKCTTICAHRDITKKTFAATAQEVDSSKPTLPPQKLLDSNSVKIPPFPAPPTMQRDGCAHTSHTYSPNIPNKAPLQSLEDQDYFSAFILFLCYQQTRITGVPKSYFLLCLREYSSRMLS